MIPGAFPGFGAIDEKWKGNPELYDVILELADDLSHRCRMTEDGAFRDPAWKCKYIDMHRKDSAPEKPAGF